MIADAIIREMFEAEEIQEVPEGFQIDSVEKANWAVCKIKEARERRNLFNQAAYSKIEQMEQRILRNEGRYSQETAFLISALDRYIETVPAKKTKTQKTFDLPDGRLKKKFASQKLVPDEERLLQYLKNEGEYINIVTKPEWGEFKKLLKEIDGKVIRTDTGEVVDFVRIEEKPESFDVE